MTLIEFLIIGSILHTQLLLESPHFGHLALLSLLHTFALVKPQVPIYASLYFILGPSLFFSRVAILRRTFRSVRKRPRLGLRRSRLLHRLPLIDRHAKRDFFLRLVIVLTGRALTLPFLLLLCRGIVSSRSRTLLGPSNRSRVLLGLLGLVPPFHPLCLVSFSSRHHVLVGQLLAVLHLQEFLLPAC